MILVPKKERGLFITFEGGDGSGKSGQAKMLERSLTESKIDCILTREPGGTPIGEKIRKIILDSENVGMSFRTELLLLEASRAQLVDELILPAINDGKIVISDRFFDSTTAYQCYGRNLCIKNVNDLNRFAAGGLVPDLTFFLDVEPKEGLARASRRTGSLDRIEQSELEFFYRLREGFQQIQKNDPLRVKIIDTSEPVDWEEVHRQILANVQMLLPI